METVGELVPWMAGFGQVDSQVEQPVHLLAVKGLLSRQIEVFGNADVIEVNLVLVRYLMLEGLNYVF